MEEDIKKLSGEVLAERAIRINMQISALQDSIVQIINELERRKNVEKTKKV